MGVGAQRHAPAAFTPGKDPVPIVQEAWWAPGSVWTGVENLASTGIRSPDRPSRSEPLYRLSYPAHCITVPTLKSVLKLRKYFRLKPIRKSKTCRVHSDGNLFSYTWCPRRDLNRNPAPENAITSFV